MADEDYYKTLDVPRSATQAEIQKAYRKLAKKYHPDLHEDKDKAKQQFQKIQAAYDVLGDEEKRKLYDQFGPQFEQMKGAGAGPFGGGYGGGQNPFGGGGMEIDLGDLFGRGGGGASGRGGGGGFEDIFRYFGGGAGGGRAPGGRSPGAGQAPPQPEEQLDHVMDITVPFAAAVSGGEHRVTLDRGAGKTETLTAKIPAGIASGQRIRLREQGHSGRGGKRGDLYLRVNVAPHPFYRRHGLHLMVTLPVTIMEALLGTKVDLPTPHGTVTLTVPAGSNSGRVLRLKGMGIKTAKGDGDLMAELEIIVPDQLSNDKKKQIRDCLEGIETKNPRSDLSW
ncbi:MAG: DnaJ C-terminal domain-containing protein [Pirellulaceae bacterium]